MSSLKFSLFKFRRQVKVKGHVRPVQRCVKAHHTGLGVSHRAGGVTEGLQLMLLQAGGGSPERCTAAFGVRE